MGSIELLRAGLAAGDWSLVRDGFEALTGQRVEPPGPTPAPEVRVDFDERAFVERVRSGFGPMLAEAVAGVMADCWVPSGPAIPVTPTTSAIPVAPTTPALPATPGRPADPLAPFRVEHNGPAASPGRRAARAEPFVPGQATNTYVDDGRDAPELVEESRVLAATREPTQRRPQAERVLARCASCPWEGEVPPLLAPRATGPDGEPAKFFCDSCLVRRHREANHGGGHGR